MSVSIKRSTSSDADRLIEIKKTAFQKEIELYQLTPPNFDSIEHLISSIKVNFYFSIYFKDKLIGGSCIKELFNKMKPFRP